jgi:hypothetical protein
MIQAGSAQMFKKHIEFQEEPTVGRKALRSEEVLNTVVEVDGLQFNADEKSMDRIDRLISLAGWKFDQALKTMSSEDAYNAVYIGIQVPWKLATDNLVQVNIEQLCRVQEISLNILGATWVKYG